MAATLVLVLKSSVVALIFAIGLGSTTADFGYLWRRPSLLVRSLFAMYVAVPLAALAAVRLFDLPLPVKTAILVLAISAGAPLLPKKLMKLGREGYVFSLVVTSSLLAIVVVPAWLTVLGRFMGHESMVEPRTVALLVAKAFLAPLVFGMVVRRLAGPRAERASDRLMKVAGVTLLLAALVLLVAARHLLLDVGWVPIAALAGMTAVALAIGHVLGGPDPDDRTALAVSCATRHVGIALLAASTAPGPGVIALVLAYVLASTAVSIPYLKWRGATAGGS